MKQRIRIHKAEPNKGVLDYSYLLDAPAGKHGFVESRKGHFYFEDGTRARFLGFNVAARSNTPDHETADKLAERFASMGVNIIRLHAADAPIGDEPGSWSSCREAPLLDYESGSSRKFHKEGLDRFDYFAAKLKEKGIYLHIDLIVAREFMDADGLDYPGGAPSCIKRYPMYNERLIELQKEYAKELLCHINPYTGMALSDDPAVVTVQINNEETAIKGTDNGEQVKLYRDEVQRRFNNYLLMKYVTRERLKEAWTYEGICALGDEEDPVQGTVRGVDGGFYQPVNDPNGAWDGECSPARYADFMEFGIHMNRKFYQMMKDYLHSLGVKVPIVTSNLIAGAADVYGHTDGDLMENNSYFNHPLLPVQGNTYGVLLAMTVDYNEWKYDKTLVATSGGAIGFGSKVGGGVGSLLLSLFLVLGSYDATVAEATTSMRYSIYGFSNYLPVVINLLMFFIFTRFDLEKKLPAMRQEVAERKAARQK